MAHFELSNHAQTVIAERQIEEAWIHHALDAPSIIKADRSDLTLIHACSPIVEYGGRFLRVVYNPTTNLWRTVTVFSIAP
ncbi:hypothetical protein BH24CHL4_BH24CHL4_25670 [soil metagenome]